jgi:DNA polymerase-2
MTEHVGWLLDLYGHPDDGVVIWLLGDDGERHRLYQPFPISFYAAGEKQKLRSLWRFLRERFPAVKLDRQEQRDLFEADPVTVLAAQVENPTMLGRVFYAAQRRFPTLTYYNADVALPLRYAAAKGVFPLARCRMTAGDDGLINNIEALDSPWDVDPDPPPLRALMLRPDCDPAHKKPTYLLARFDDHVTRYPLENTRRLLIGLGALLRRRDPDLLLTSWGDSWLLPHLLERVEEGGIPLPLNREDGFDIQRRPERTYHSYGQVIYRGPKLTLFGRWHIDSLNAVMFHDYGLDGVLEMARVTRLPIQTAARVSPGTGISAMQMVQALEDGILIPYQKQQTERFKTPLTLMQSDQGGLVYQPIIGLHPHVGEIDFTSMYPSIMVHFNISPETVSVDAEAMEPGLIPRTLKPLLEKRIALKRKLLIMDHRDVRYERVKALSSAHKWLLVTCFGYLGYKNARFGRIEAHEAVTAYGREALLLAKEAAEDLGFRVLHMYIDGLWVQKEGAKQVDDFQPLLEEIVDRTGLPIGLDGIYRWIAFLPSKTDPRVPVANRFFGVLQACAEPGRSNGRIKMRGIEARRRDTPPFIKQAQRDALELLAQVPDMEQLQAYLPKVVKLWQDRLDELRSGKVPLEQLLVTQKLSRALEQYKVPSPAARAVAQLQAVGKEVKVGQYVRFLYTIGEPGVHAWDLPQRADPSRLDLDRYAELLLRAAHTVLQPLGVKEETLRWWLFSNAGYGAPPGELREEVGLPLFTSQTISRRW